MGAGQSSYSPLKENALWYMEPSSRPSQPYDPGEWLLTSMTRFSGTAVQMVLFKPTFWLLIGAHLGFHSLNSSYGALPVFDVSAA